MKTGNKTFQAKNSKAVAINSQDKKGYNKPETEFVDNRHEFVAQRILQETVHNSSQAKNAVQLQTMANNHVAQQQVLIQKKENGTGLPDNLKSGVENLSGYSMDDVNVHRNSDKPAELQAHAYAQGTDIHLGAGQEKHLPHEAWHVVQQKQGRVKPTKQLKGKTNINDDVGLENEADVMGAKALGETMQAKSKEPPLNGVNSATHTVQRAENVESEKGAKTKSFDASVQQDMLILRGDTTIIGRIQGSEFTQLHNAVNEYATADLEKKQELIWKIHSLGKSYLKNYKHDESNENHQLRKASIERIVDRISQFDQDSNAAAATLGVASTDDKIGVGAKLKKAFFGEDTPFVQAVNAFTNYQNQISSLETDDSEEGIKFLSGVLDNANLIQTKIEEWKAIHDKDQTKSEDLNDKRGIIKMMETKLGVISLNLRFKYKNLFKFTGEKVTIDPLKKDFTIASIKVSFLDDVPEPLQNLEAEAKVITYKDKEFDFSEISLTKPPSDYEPLPGFKLTTPGQIILKKSGTEYTLEIAESSVNITVGNFFKGDAKGKGTFKYNSGAAQKLRLVDIIDLKTISIELLEDVPAPLKNVKATAEDVKMKSESNSFDVDFAKISITAKPKVFQPIGGLSFTTPDSLELIKRAKGQFTMQVGETQVEVTFLNWFTANAKASGIFNYQSGADGKLESDIKIPTAKVSLGDEAPKFIKGITGEVKDLNVFSNFNEKDPESNGIDWKQITVSTPPKGIKPFNGPITITAPDRAEILGPRENYKTTFRGANASANIGEKINANGSADFFIDNAGNSGITGAELKVKGETPKIPEEIIPNIWPIELGMQVTFIPTPITAAISLGVGGGVQANFMGTIKKEDNAEKLTFNAEAGLLGNVYVSIKVGAGVGSSYVFYAGVFAEAKAQAEAIGKSNLKGFFEKDGETGYRLAQANLEYELSAALTAQLSAGAEAKALYIFQKTLFEVKSAKWNIGESNRNGSYNLINKENTDKGGMGLLVGDEKSIPKKINAENTGKVENKLEGFSPKLKEEWPEIDATIKLIEQILDLSLIHI